MTTKKAEKQKAIENVEKLKSRYPGGEFDASKSENREEGDV